MSRKLFIPISLAKTIDDAWFLAPEWTKDILSCEGGWMCFENPPPPDVWEFSR